MNLILTVIPANAGISFNLKIPEFRFAASGMTTPNKMTLCE